MLTAGAASLKPSFSNVQIICFCIPLWRTYNIRPYFTLHLYLGASLLSSLEMDLCVHAMDAAAITKVQMDYEWTSASVHRFLDVSAHLRKQGRFALCAQIAVWISWKKRIRSFRAVYLRQNVPYRLQVFHKKNHVLWVVPILRAPAPISDKCFKLKSHVQLEREIVILFYSRNKECDK